MYAIRALKAEISIVVYCLCNTEAASSSAELTKSANGLEENQGREGMAIDVNQYEKMHGKQLSMFATHSCRLERSMGASESR